MPTAAVIWLLIATFSTGINQTGKHTTRHFDSWQECVVAAADMAALLRNMHTLTEIACKPQQLQGEQQKQQQYGPGKYDPKEREAAVTNP